MPLALMAVLQLALAVQPPPPAEVTPRDFLRLQDDLTNLDELLQGLEPDDPATEPFRSRARVLEEDLVPPRGSARARKPAPMSRSGRGFAKAAAGAAMAQTVAVRRRVLGTRSRGMLYRWRRR